MRGLSPRIALLIVLGVTLSTFPACGSSPPPAWVRQGAASLAHRNPGTLYGVGSAKGIRNGPLAWDVAENRARAALLRELRTHTASLRRDYTGGNADRTGEGQDAGQAVKTFAAGALRAVRAHDRYEDPETGTHYVAVKADLRDLPGGFARANASPGLAHPKTPGGQPREEAPGPR